MLLANEFANAGIEPDDYRRWQRKAKMRAAIRTVLNSRCGHHRGIGLANGQPNIDPCIFGAEEAVEKVFKVGGSNAWSIVEQGKDDRTVFIGRASGYRSGVSAVPTAQSPGCCRSAG